MTLAKGDPIPDFDLPTDDRGQITAQSLLGKAYVLYLYPKDDTPGCTKEAIGFTEKKAEFDAIGVDIIGLSKDSIEKHAKFRGKYELGISLASDEDGALIEALGAWVEKSMYGKTYMGIDRATFLVDEAGKVQEIWRKVKVPGHVEEVFDAASAMKKGSNS